MTEKDRAYIFNVKNMLALNTPRKEISDILSDLTENAEESGSSADRTEPGTEKPLSHLKEHFGSPFHFIQELKNGHIAGMIVKSLFILAIIAGAGAMIRYIITYWNIGRNAIQIASFVFYLILVALYLLLLKDTLPEINLLASPSVSGKRFFTVLLAVSSILCLPELWLQTIGIQALAEHYQEMDIYAAAKSAHNLIVYGAWILIVLHSAIAIIALYRSITRAEVYMSGIVLQSITAAFATCWMHFYWTGSISDAGYVYGIGRNWIITYVLSIGFAILWYRYLTKHK